MRKRDVSILIGTYLMCVALAGFLWRRPVALTVCYLAVGIVLIRKWHSKRDIFYYAVGFIMGPAGELAAVYLGAWTYAKPLFLLPLWLPFLWGIAALFVMKLAESLVGE